MVFFSDEDLILYTKMMLKLNCYFFIDGSKCGGWLNHPFEQGSSEESEVSRLVSSSKY